MDAFNDATILLHEDANGPSIRITGINPTHRQSRWFATGYCGVTYQTEYSDHHHINHVLGSFPEVDKAITSACNAVSGHEFMAGRIRGPLQVVNVSLSPLREPDGRILVFFAVTLEEMPKLPQGRKKKD